MMWSSVVRDVNRGSGGGKENEKDERERES